MTVVPPDRSIGAHSNSLLNWASYTGWTSSSAEDSFLDPTTDTKPVDTEIWGGCQRSSRCDQHFQMLLEVFWGMLRLCVVSPCFRRCPIGFWNASLSSKWKCISKASGKPSDVRGGHAQPQNTSQTQPKALPVTAGRFGEAFQTWLWWQVKSVSPKPADEEGSKHCSSKNYTFRTTSLATLGT